MPAPEARIKNFTITRRAAQKPLQKRQSSPRSADLTAPVAGAARRSDRRIDMALLQSRIRFTGSASSTWTETRFLRLAEDLRQTLHWLIQRNTNRTEPVRGGCMRRSRTTFAFLALLLSCIALSLPSCGGSSAGKVVSITLTPSPVSVAYGQVDITTDGCGGQ